MVWAAATQFFQLVERHFPVTRADWFWNEANRLTAHISWFAERFLLLTMSFLNKIFQNFLKRYILLIKNRFSAETDRTGFHKNRSGYRR